MLKSAKPFFLGAKAFGSNSYEIKGYKIIMTKTRICLLIVINLVCIPVTAYTLIQTLHISRNMKSQLFLIFRVVFTYISILTDMFITIKWKNQLTLAMDHILMYDISARFREKIHYPTLNWCRIAVTLIMSLWAVSAYETFVLHRNNPLLATSVYIALYSGLAMQIFYFSGWMLLLYRRFDYLGKLVNPKELFTKMNVKVINKSCCEINLQDVWFMHYNLLTAAEKINNVYSLQLLLWIFSLSLNTLSRLNTVINSDGKQEILKIRDVICALGFFLLLMVLIIPCHITSYRANQVAEKVFFPTSIIRRKSSRIKNEDAQAYFCIKKLQFTAAAGFIHIELPLLISVACGISTYLVILYKASSKN